MCLLPPLYFSFEKEHPVLSECLHSAQEESRSDAQRTNSVPIPFPGWLLHHTLPPASEARKPGEEPRRPLDRSPPLGQVQPHFTAQDAKSAEDECPSRHLGKHRPRSAQVGSRLDALQGLKTQHSIHTVTCKSPQQQEDRSPKPPQAPERPEEHRRQSHSSSSFSSGALQDTWRLLDLGSSPSGLTSQGDSTPELPAPPAAHRSPVKTQAGVATPGMKTAAQAKVKPTGASRSHPAKAKSCQRPPKIRNNIMDTSSPPSRPAPPGVPVLSPTCWGCVGTACRVEAGSCRAGSQMLLRRPC
ncbi:coiled-coil domain-containing protein 57 [Hylobates moloch]|uniref:coiled-coil domain-containing protein 57 n=1 Tax=Hylobates moloch TaxID=81572 RepID=UPI0026747A06|nr:coiled-coil domain-containing protein 57 [Hylobates moloch]